MSDKYDVIIIGGGNAGFAAAAVAHAAGKTIAFIEKRDFGGTCPNRGCTPKKVLVAAGQALHGIELAGAHGIDVGEPRLDWRKLIRREKNLIAHIPDAMAGLAEKRGDVYRGTAVFLGPNAVSVNGRTLEGSDIVIATGSSPRHLPIPGAEFMITSDDILSEETQPGEIVFIGGGVIAMEFSHVYARAGTKVTILEAMPALLPQFDEDAVTALRVESSRLGIGIHMGVEVREVQQAGSRLRVIYADGNGEKSIDADRVVNGAGRTANVEGLHLEAARVRHDQFRIETDEYLRSATNPVVWVCGDAMAGSPQLSPVATYEGRIVGRNIAEGPVSKPDYSVIPSCVYTVPALSAVGLTEKAARGKGLNLKITTNDMTSWFSGNTYAEPVAYAKVIVDQDADSIIGAHMVGHHGEELIHFFAMAMRHGIKAG